MERITRAVIVQTTIVSMNGSRPATTPSRTGSSVLTALWAIGALPWPASLLNRARWMPVLSSTPNVTPVNAPVAVVASPPSQPGRPLTTISRSSPGSSPTLSTRT